MAKLNTADLTSLSNDQVVVNTINSNFAATRAAMEKTLTRTGTAPNMMLADLDMNSYDILNVGNITTSPSTGIHWLSLVDQTVINGLVDNDIVYIGNGAHISTITITGLTYVKFIFQPGTVFIDGRISLVGCTRLIFEGDWTTLKWNGSIDIPMWSWEHTQYCTWRRFYIGSAPFDHPLDSAFWSISRTGGGQVSTQNVFEDIFVDGTDDGGLQYGWRIGVEGEGNGDNDDFHRFTRVTVVNYNIAAYSIEQPEAKFITFHDSGFLGNGFGQYGVSTALNGNQGGSFLFRNGGGGGTSEADFFLGSPDDLISIEGCQLESSNRVLLTNGFFSVAWPVCFRDCRIASDNLNADNKIMIYTNQGPLMLINCTFEAFGKPLEIHLNPVFRCIGVAIGCTVSSTLANPFTVDDPNLSQWHVYGNMKGIDGADFTSFPLSIPVMPYAELPSSGMMQGGLAIITDSNTQIEGALIAGGGTQNVLAVHLGGGNWYVAGSDTPGAGDIASIEILIDGGGVPITTGIKGDLEVPFNATIQSATLMSDIAGNLTVDVWKDNFGAYPPTIADTITAGTPPTLTAANKSQDTTLTSWIKTIVAGDTLRFNVSGSPTVNRATLSLKCIKT